MTISNKDIIAALASVMALSPGTISGDMSSEEVYESLYKWLNTLPQEKINQLIKEELAI